MKKEGFLENIYRDAFKHYFNTIEFWDDILNGTKDSNIRLKFHQAIRIYEVIENGNKKIACADATSSGKSLIAFVIKALLDKKAKRRTKALVLAPEQAIRTVWTPQEVNGYCRSLNLPAQNILHVFNKNDLNKIGKETDFIALNYHKFGYKENSEENEYFQSILRLCRDIDIFILDECQNFKNPNNNRSRTFKQIIDKTKDKYFILLSATPVPNRLKDAGTLLHILDSENYPFGPYDYNSNPSAIRDMQLAGKWFTFSREDVKELFDLPDLKILPPRDIEMNNKYVERYFDIWKKDMGPGRKIAGLMKVLVESKLDSFQELVRDIKNSDKDKQILVFTYLKKGVIDAIVERLGKLYKKEQIAVLHGDKSLEERVETAKRFGDGEIKALVNTITTMGEGIALITYERPCAIINVQPPNCPGHYDQIIGRPYRKDQEGAVEVHMLRAVSKKLENMMKNSKEYLERKYKVKFPATWRPTTLDIDIDEKRQAKEKIIQDKVYHGIRLDDILEETIMNTDIGSPQEAYKKGILTSLPPLSQKKPQKNKFVDGFRASSSLYGKGSNVFREATEGTGKYAVNCNKLFDGYDSPEWYFSSAADTNRMITKVIKTLEELEGRKFGWIIDLGSGIGCLARILKRPIVNLDMWEKMLRRAREKCEKLKLEKIENGLDKMMYIRSNMYKIPFENEVFDVAVSSYSSMYLSQRKKNIRQIEDTIIETNRILKPRGFFVLALPNQATREEEFEKLKNTIKKYNFGVLLYDFYKGKTKSKSGRSKMVFPGAYLLLAQKRSLYNRNYATQEGFDMYYPRNYSATGGIGRIILRGLSNERKKIEKRLISNEFVSKNNRDITEHLKNIYKFSR